MCTCRKAYQSIIKKKENRISNLCNCMIRNFSKNLSLYVCVFLEEIGMKKGQETIFS